MALFGYSARRLAAATSLGLVVALAARSALGPLAGDYSTPIAILLSAFPFAAGLLLYREAALVSASVALSSAAFRLAGLPADPGRLAAASLAAAFLLWPASRRREYALYAILGGSALAYFASYLTHGALAALLAASTAFVGYAIQERVWRARSRYERILARLARYSRSAARRAAPLRRTRERPESL